MGRTLARQILESPRQSPCNNLGQTVSGVGAARWGRGDDGPYASSGERKYLNREERSRVLAAMEALDPERSLFALVLAWTGARVSEVLALTPASFQLESAVVTIVTLKRRKPSIREVPIPPALMRRLQHCFSLRRSQRTGDVTGRLWPFTRVTAWRLIKSIMQGARITGRRACPRGLRHGFGVGTLQSGVPLNLIQRWMGHARMHTTAIYAAVCGPEEISFARRFWRAAPSSEFGQANLKG